MRHYMRQENGRMAERAGFEPALEFPLNTLSKRAPSATRPSLPNQLPPDCNENPGRRPEGFGFKPGAAATWLGGVGLPPCSGCDAHGRPQRPRLPHRIRTRSPTEMAPPDSTFASIPLRPCNSRCRPARISSMRLQGRQGVVIRSRTSDPI